MNRTQELQKIFGTPNPSPSAIRRWKRRWLKSPNRIKISGMYSTAWQLAVKLDILPDLMQHYFCNTTQTGYIVFYREEDLFHYKLNDTQ